MSDATPEQVQLAWPAMQKVNEQFMKLSAGTRAKLVAPASSEEKTAMINGFNQADAN